MKKQSMTFLMIASLGFTASAIAQQPTQPSPYSGVSQPPTDVIETTPDAQPIPKPSAAVVAQQQVTAQDPVQPRTSYVAQPELMTRPVVADPDGDIVHPRVGRPGELMPGQTIRVRLLDRLSSTDNEKGQRFRGQVAYDVLQNGQVLIPAGSAIEGRVTDVSSGKMGKGGSFRLNPEAVILPDGGRYQLHAETTGTPGSKTKMGSEGSIRAGSRAKKDGIEYGAVMGTGAIAGAVLGGPIGALTGTVVGAGIVTTHLLVNHAQATLEPGSMVNFTLTEPMNLSPIQN
jgi:hypothetical protein